MRGHTSGVDDQRDAGMPGCRDAGMPGCRDTSATCYAGSTGLAGALVRGLSYCVAGTERQQMSNDGLARREAVCPGDVESR